MDARRKIIGRGTTTATFWCRITALLMLIAHLVIYEMPRIYPSSIAVRSASHTIQTEPATIPKCHPDTLGKGTWVPLAQQAQRQHDEFTCCSNEYNCPVDHLIIQGHGCACQRTRGDDFRSILNFDWIPSSSVYSLCTFPQFSPREFCNLMPRHKTILFIGDSLMKQMFGGLSSVLYHANETCWQRFAYQASDTLINEKLGSGVMNRGIPLNATLVAWFNGYTNFSTNPLIWPDSRTLSNLVVVVQVGAHIQGLTLHEATSRASRVANLVKTWREYYHHVDMLWVTQLFGHSQCSADSVPLTTEEQVIESLQQHDRYHHSWYFAKTSTMLDVIKEAGIPVVDMSALRFRHDSHVVVDDDCLHQCIPGPLTQLFPRIFQRVWETALLEGKIRA